MSLRIQFTATVIAMGLVFGFGHVLLHAQKTDRWAESRFRMARYVFEQGVKDPRVRAALTVTPRHQFVAISQRQNAYFDTALPIGHGQTISPPFVVAYMTEQLKPQPKDKVLEIGTGSGYQAAVLSPLVAEVYSIEIVEPLGKKAAATLKRLNYKNVTTKIGDGYLGWKEHAPFDKIIVTCSPEKIPVPLIEQLREGGRMVIPLGERFKQLLYLYKKVDGKLQEVPLQPTFFVPMTGKAEALRIVKEDSVRPVLRNASFEETGLKDAPAGWYAVRLGSVQPDSNSPKGKKCLAFKNDIRGRWAQALQAVAVDGRRVGELEISLWVRGSHVVSNPSLKKKYHVELNFFNENRAPVGKRKLGPWEGTYDWSKKTAKWKVPSTARLAVLALSLAGGTGEMSFDNVQIAVTKERAAAVNPR